jgi:hypothetical protein
MLCHVLQSSSLKGEVNMILRNKFPMLDQHSLRVKMTIEADFDRSNIVIEIKCHASTVLYSLSRPTFF